ncbi:hypothetical protein C8F04DRAFT_1257570 [Mycena alexandri]|uniref:Uncharacterized protein n=1 Tax=Mycena alexandri TaxID=1745969 RepID=A0AAD6X4U2_9AGAR|nr:hypothetical protein C8F04DRAFT_1257570 [Mycena alexandri]
MSDPPDPRDTPTSSYLSTSTPCQRLDNANLTDSSAVEASAEAASSAAVANITLQRKPRAHLVALKGLHYVHGWNGKMLAKVCSGVEAKY